MDAGACSYHFYGGTDLLLLLACWCYSRSARLGLTHTVGTPVWSAIGQFAGYAAAFSVAISTTKRYFTSLLSMRS